MTDLSGLFQRIADGYRTAYHDIYGISSSAPDTAGRNRPSSRPPRGAATYIRGQLVDCARLILDAQWKAGGPQRPRWAGFGSNLGWRPGVNRREATGPRDAVAEIAARAAGHDVHVTYRPMWAPDRTDLVVRPPSPTQLRAACHATEGRAADVHDQDIEHVVEQLVREALRCVARAGGDQEGARRIQHRNIQELQEKVCVDCGVTTEPGKRVHGRCKSCDNRWRYQQSKVSA